MFHYKLYGLFVSSSIEFNFLDEIIPNRNSDITISESFESHDYAFSNNFDSINITKAVIYRTNIGHFEINHGREIKFYRENAFIKDDAIAKSLINAVIGFCLYQRGYFVIHASSIEINNNSFLFFGRSGSGKSSLSGDLCINYGANFICEDVACIKDQTNFSIEYAPAFIKLSDEISGLLKFDSKMKMELLSDRLRRSIFKMNQYPNKNNLKACFFLEWGNSFSIKKMDDSEILPAFLLTAYTSFPFNSCQQSSILFHKNINKIYPRIPLYKLTRNKKDLFKDTGDINNFLTGF